MANKGRATFAKRQKEIARQERAREKAAKRVERKETSRSSTRKAAEVDPDIAGIVPGPQPLPYDPAGRGRAEAVASAHSVSTTTPFHPHIDRVLGLGHRRPVVSASGA
jgi:hypothetical protein